MNVALLPSSSGATRVAMLFPSGGHLTRMDDSGMRDYIIDEEEHLSPVVVVTTVLLVAAFALGLLYQVVSLAL